MPSAKPEPGQSAAVSLNSSSFDSDSVFEESHRISRVHEIELNAIIVSVTNEEIAWKSHLLTAIRNGQA